MKLASLCSGYGGLDLAVESHFNNKGEQVEIVWFAENNRNCKKILKHHWGNIPNYGDIKTIDWSLVPSCDILTAGYPCQPFSHAGDRKIDDERNIWEYIADGISILRPEYIVLENVSAHLTLGGTSVVGSLASMGYCLRYGIVRASDTFAPHQRSRWFCLATDTSSKRHGGWQNNRTVGDFIKKLESKTWDSTREKFEHRISEDYGEYTKAIRRWERITRPIPKDNYLLFVEWMMGLPEGWVTGHGLSRTAQLTMLGNGVVPLQGELALSLLDV